MRNHTLARFIVLAVLLWLLSGVLRAEDTLYEPSLRAHEGYRTSPYQEANGSWVVGIGHSLTANRQVPKHSYTQAEISAFYASDLRIALSAARRSVEGFDGLPEGVRIALVHIAWTCGPTGLHRWVNLRRTLRYHAYDLAAAELRSSLWARQVSPKRLEYCYGLLHSQAQK